MAISQCAGLQLPSPSSWPQAQAGGPGALNEDSVRHWWRPRRERKQGRKAGAVEVPRSQWQSQGGGRRGVVPSMIWPVFLLVLRTGKPRACIVRSLHSQRALDLLANVMAVRGGFLVCAALTGPPLVVQGPAVLVRVGTAHELSRCGPTLRTCSGHLWSKRVHQQKMAAPGRRYAVSRKPLCWGPDCCCC